MKMVIALSRVICDYKGTIILIENQKYCGLVTIPFLMAECNFCTFGGISTDSVMSEAKYCIYFFVLLQHNSIKYFLSSFLTSSLSHFSSIIMIIFCLIYFTFSLESTFQKSEILNSLLLTLFLQLGVEFVSVLALDGMKWYSIQTVEPRQCSSVQKDFNTYLVYKNGRNPQF